jgi:hypothetical protein
MNNSTTKKNAKRARGVFEKDPGSGVWWVRYADENGRLHREKVSPKGLALKVYRRRKTEVQEKRFFPEQIRRREVLLSDAIDEHLSLLKGRRQSFRDYLRNGNIWKAALGNKTLRQIVPGDIERYISKRTQEVSPASVNRELAYLKHLFNGAIADGKVENNPVRQVKMLKENNQRVRFLAREEEEVFREAAGEGDWQVIAFAMNTGMRLCSAKTFRSGW